MTDKGAWMSPRKAWHDAWLHRDPGVRALAAIYLIVFANVVVVSAALALGWLQVLLAKVS